MPSPDRASAPQRIRTRDGTVLRTRIAGDPRASRRIALVHSLAMDHTFWRSTIDALPPDVAVLAYDARGHGESDKPSGPYAIEGFADDLADLFDAIGWRSAVVAGASMGGCVSLAFAGRHPSRVQALGLIDTTCWYGEAAPTQWAARAQSALDEGLEALVAFQTTRWFSDDFRSAHPGIVAESVATFLKTPPAAYADSCRMLGACDLREVLGRIRIATAILVGEQDYATPVAMAEALHAGIAGSRLTIIANGRHLTPLEQPGLIADALHRLSNESHP